MSPLEKTQAKLLATIVIGFFYVSWLLYTGRLMNLFDYIISFERNLP